MTEAHEEGGLLSVVHAPELLEAPTEAVEGVHVPLAAQLQEVGLVHRVQEDRGHRLNG
jgi:hypothetical protein